MIIKFGTRVLVRSLATHSPVFVIVDFVFTLIVVDHFIDMLIYGEKIN